MVPTPCKPFLQCCHHHYYPLEAELDFFHRSLQHFVGIICHDGNSKRTSLSRRLYYYLPTIITRRKTTAIMQIPRLDPFINNVYKPPVESEPNDTSIHAKCFLEIYHFLWMNPSWKTMCVNRWGTRHRPYCTRYASYEIGKRINPKDTDLSILSSRCLLPWQWTNVTDPYCRIEP